MKKKQVTVTLSQLISLRELKSARKVLDVVKDVVTQVDFENVNKESRMFSMELQTASMRIGNFLDIFESEINATSKTKRTKK